MKTTIPAVLIQFLLGMAAFGQTPYTTTFAIGDIAAYRYTEHDQQGALVRSTVAVRKIRAAPPLLNRDAVNDTAEVTSFIGSLFTFPGLETFFSKTNLGMTVTADGVLRSYDYMDKKWQSLLLLSPPASDTIMIDTMQVVVTQRFDTTVFGHTVRAFRMSVGGATDKRQLTVADTFGLIQAQMVSYDRTLTVELINATILGVRYNADGRSFDYMPICLGDVRHYKHYFTPQQTPSQRQIRNYSIAVTTDTTVNGVQYFKLTPPQGYLIRDSLDGVHQLDPVYKVQTFFLPSDATLGSLVGGMVVVDTASVFFWGKTRRKIALSNEVVDISVYEEWMEGLGKSYGISYSYFSGIDMDSLAYGKLCGTEYGTALGVDRDAPGSAGSALISDVFPNPATRSNPVTVVYSMPAGGAAALTLFDILGRTVAVPYTVVTCEGMNSVRLSFADLPSGLYFLQLRASSAVDSKLLFIR